MAKGNNVLDSRGLQSGFPGSKRDFPHGSWETVIPAAPAQDFPMELRKTGLLRRRFLMRSIANLRPSANAPISTAKIKVREIIGSPKFIPEAHGRLY
jgi:hypothetical protein